MRDFFRKIGFDRKDFWLAMFWIGLIMINLVWTPTPLWVWIVQGFMFWIGWKPRVQTWIANWKMRDIKF